MKVLVVQSCLILQCHAPLSMGFSGQGYWSRLTFPPPGDLSDPSIKPRSPTLQTDSLLSELPGKLDMMYWVTRTAVNRIFGNVVLSCG